MKAAFIVGPRQFEIRDIDMPVIGDDEMLVRVDACGVCSSDMSGYLGTGSATMQARNPYPRRAGHEPAGTVVEVGRNVVGYGVGDRITGYFADGCYAEYVCCNPSDRAARGHGAVIARIPQGVPAEHALGEPLMSLVSIARTANPEFGDYVFQVGCGFMGLLLVQCLARSFAERLVAADVSPERLALASQFGADTVLNPLQADAEAQIAALQALEIDTVVDASGSQAGFALTQRLVRRGGRINNFGWIHGDVTISGDAWHMLGYTVVNSSPAARLRDPFPTAIRLLAADRIDTRPLVTHVVSLDEMGALLASVAAGQEKRYIKGVVTLQDA